MAAVLKGLISGTIIGGSLAVSKALIDGESSDFKEEFKNFSTVGAFHGAATGLLQHDVDSYLGDAGVGALIHTMMQKGSSDPKSFIFGAGLGVLEKTLTDMRKRRLKSSAAGIRRRRKSHRKRKT